jgi:hypothetical protein
MTSKQVTTWRRYTAAEKKAYRARELKRRTPQVWINGVNVTKLVSNFSVGPLPPLQQTRRHHFAGNYGPGVPTARVNGELL